MPAGPTARPRFLRDEGGGVVVLRGTNVAGEAKWRPNRLPPHGREDFERLRDELGFSAIRLLVFWEAIEPERGQYDEAYLRAVRRTVDEAGRAGLRVLVDMHQDLFGGGFGSAGAPSWAGGAAAFEAPEPWFLGYLTGPVMSAFDRLWSDDGLQAAFVEAWARLAASLAGAESLVAYDLFNEPSWGSATPACLERAVLPRFYTRVIDAIRKVDPSTWVAIEPAPTASLGWGTRLVPPPRDRILYAPHLYPAAIELGIGYGGDADDLDRQVAAIAAWAGRIRVPALVGEVGVRRGVPGAARYLADAYDALDRHQLGAFQWDLGRGGEGSYALWDRRGRATELARAVARPAPCRIAGEPRGWRFDRSTGDFEARWFEDGLAAGDSVFSVPDLAYPKGVRADVSDGGQALVEGRRVRVPPRGGGRTLRIRAYG